MKRWKTLSAAEQAAIIEHNQAQLGTKWQERPLTEREQRLDRAMDMWRAKDAYDAECMLPLVVLVGLFLLVVFLASIFR